MNVWFLAWIGLSLVVALHDDIDDRPWWGRAIYAMLIGGIIAAPFGLAVLVFHGAMSR